MQQAQQAMQQAMDDPAVQDNPAAQDYLQGLQGLFGGAGAAAQPLTGPQFSLTGNTGTTNGMDWEEVQVQMGADTVVYRVADWADVPGSAQLAEHYLNMGEIYQAMMQNSGLGQFMQGMQAWPEEITAYMVDNQKIPIYIEDDAGVAQLTSVENGTLEDDRFGPRFTVQGPFPGL